MKKLITGLLLLSLCLLVFMLPIGCSKKETPQKSIELVILCGSSFVPPTDQLCSEFMAQTGIQTVQTIGGSEDLLPHVKAGLRPGRAAAQAEKRVCRPLHAV